jgi:hypothetical protein
MFMKSPCNYQEKIRHYSLIGTNGYNEENYEHQYTFKKEHCSLKPAEKMSSCNQKLSVAYHMLKFFYSKKENDKIKTLPLEIW